MFPLQVIPDATLGVVRVRPADLSVEEAGQWAEKVTAAVEDWKRAEKARDDQWHNRAGGSGPDTTLADNVALAAADDVRDLLTLSLKPEESWTVGDDLITAALRLAFPPEASA
jgi:hypothetical protein